ncbi:MAG: hypothetical protein JW850_20895 [Thermoflexales bacterium]|nr:hypothetical protein [Thermoflexales bacterium]
MKIHTSFKITLLVGLVLAATLSLNGAPFLSRALASPDQARAGAMPAVLRAAAPPASSLDGALNGPGLAVPPAARLAQTFNCTLNTSSYPNPDGIGGSNFDTATPLAASYPNLVLAPGTVNQSVPAVDEYFYLDAAIGTVYKIEAFPNSTTNYNLGIVIYSPARTPILSDTNSLDNNSASLQFTPLTSGRYYVKVHQLSPGCTGGSYRLTTTLLTPTNTPTVTLTPTPQGGVFLTDTLEGASGNNSFGTAAGVSVGGTYNYLTFYWNYVPYHPYGADVDYYKFNGTAGHHYQVEVLVAAGLNSYLEIYNSAYQLVTSNDDRAASDYGSLASWSVASSGMFYIKVTNTDLSDPINKTYTLKITDISPTWTPTPSTPTPSSAGCSAQDAFEPNNNWDQATILQIGLQYSNLNFWPDYPAANPAVYDVDYYRVWCKTEWGRYRVETSGWDTLVIVYAPDGAEVGRNDDKAYNDSGSRVVWMAGSDGWYTILVDRSTGSRLQPSCGTYSLVIDPLDVTPTPQPTSSAPTPVTGYDKYEPNHNFNNATTIGLGVEYALNFVPYAPWNGHMEDNDFFKLRVKTGLLVTCETYDLSTGTDTNMIFYSETQADACGSRPANECQGLAGNDDVNTPAGQFQSRLSYFATYEGWLYILVGQGHAIPLTEASGYSYKLRCSVGAQSTATPKPTSVSQVPTLVSYPTSPPTYTPYPTFTPLPGAPPIDTPQPTPPLPATATPLPPIAVRPLATPVPPGLQRQAVSIELTIFYDRNENGQVEAGEGVVGLQTHVYDLADGALLAQGFTDESGKAVLSAAALGSVRVVVPYLGFQAVISASGGALQVRISPRQLPIVIP